MKESGWSRPLRYFVSRTQLSVLGIAAGSFAMAVYIWFINTSMFETGHMFANVPSALVYLSMIVLFVGGMSFQQNYTIPVSFGCRRKDAYAANLAANQLFIAQSLILYLVFVHVLQMNAFYLDAWIVLAVLLVLESVSRLLGIVSARWKKGTYIMTAGGVVIASMFFGVWAGYTGENGSIIPFAAMLGGDWKWAILCGGMLIYAAANITGFYMFRNFEVRV